MNLSFVLCLKQAAHCSCGLFTKHGCWRDHAAASSALQETGCDEQAFAPARLGPRRPPQPTRYSQLLFPREAQTKGACIAGGCMHGSPSLHVDSASQSGLREPSSSSEIPCEPCTEPLARQCYPWGPEWRSPWPLAGKGQLGRLRLMSSCLMRTSAEGLGSVLAWRKSRRKIGFMVYVAYQKPFDAHGRGLFFHPGITGRREDTGRLGGRKMYS